LWIVSINALNAHVLSGCAQETNLSDLSIGQLPEAGPAREQQLGHIQVTASRE
jgi:hypothetical protein